MGRDLWVTITSMILSVLIIAGVVWLYGPYGLIGSGVAGLICMYVGVKRGQ